MLKFGMKTAREEERRWKRGEETAELERQTDRWRFTPVVGADRR